LNPNDHGKRVSGLFDNIAAWYDFLNHFLSAGQDVYWRYRLVRFVRPGPTGRVLDLAAGTLDVSREILRQHPDLRVLGMDFSRAMLCKGKGKVAGSTAIFPVQADGRALPLPDGCVDTVTIAFGIRNVVDRLAGLREMYRVLKPGGRAVILEFSNPRSRLFKALYYFYFRRILPFLGGLLSQRSAYQYLPDSVLEFPDQSTFKALMAEAGFTELKHFDLTFGIATVYVGTRPV